MGFKSILKSAFPFISAAAGLGGPVGTMAANAVGKALGVEKVDPTPEGIEKAINDAQIKDPEALLKLQSAEQEFSLQMKKLGYDTAVRLEELSTGDRASARAREIALKDRIPALLAIAVTLGFFGLLGMLLFRTVPEQSKDIINIMVGSLGTAWISIVAYYFGSSSGSAKKTELLAQMSESK